MPGDRAFSFVGLSQISQPIGPLASARTSPDVSFIVMGAFCERCSPVGSWYPPESSTGRLFADPPEARLKQRAAGSRGLCPLWANSLVWTAHKNVVGRQRMRPRRDNRAAAR